MASYKISRQGFTLAEVLITLAVIGVVAALTIPGLINSVQQSQYNASIQKAYSMLSQAVITIQENNGKINVGSDPGDGSQGNYFRDDFCSVLSCTKKDTDWNTLKIPSQLYSGYKTTSGWDSFSDDNPASQLSNGMYLLNFTSFPTCNNGGIKACGYFIVDVNGPQKPNMEGMDAYMFWIVQNNGVYALEPAGIANAPVSPYNTCASGGGGFGCTYNRLTTPDNMP